MTAAPTISAKAKERPILFSAPMVKAILAGTKSQTRRAMNPQPMPVSFAFTYKGVEWGEKTARPRNVLSLCPYGQPGDRLWVKETFHGARSEERHKNPIHPMDCMSYRATDGEFPEGTGNVLKWTPSIFMPRWASRLTLEIVAVRVERLGDISEQDAKAEGAPEPTGRIGSYPAPWATGKPGPISYRQTFQKIWEGINGKDSWAQSPWVWVIEFKRITP